MASTYSNLKIELIGTGDQSGSWGVTTNTNLGTALEEAIVGSADVTFASGDVTVTLTDTNATQTARNLRLNCTGTTGGSTRNLILGSGCQIEKPYLINNGCADSITVKNTTGTGITVPAGKSMWVYNNGTNVVDAVTHLSSLTLGSALPVGSGGTGATTLTANNVILGNGTSAVQFVAPGSTGNVLTSNGTTWSSTAPAVSLSAAQTFTAAQTFRAANAIRSEAASTQDAVIIAGRAGGTSSYAITLTPDTLSANRTLTLPDPGENVTLGYLNIPQNIQTGSYTLVLADAGKHIYRGSGSAATWTIPANASVAYPIGTALTFINLSATSVSIAITSDTMYLSSAGTTGTRTLAQYGSATAVKIASTTWIISGSGLT